jgi:hypothetical protein
MPLTWDVSACADVDKVTDTEWGITNTLILMTMSIGMGQITEKNAAEVYTRLRFLDKLYGPPMRSHNTETDEWGEQSFTPQMVRDRIGLRCNVSLETRAAFMRRHLKWFMVEGEREYLNAEARVGVGAGEEPALEDDIAG